jgi:hypothetical protein
MEEKSQVNEFKGFNLFNDIVDENLRAHNRGAVMSNIIEMYKGDKNIISGKGTAILIGYFDKIPMSERQPVLDKFNMIMEKNGYVKINP